MNKMEELKNIIKESKKRIILPEGEDNRVLEAASKVIEENLVDIIILGEKKDNYPNLSKATFINPKDIDLTYYINKLYELRKEKGLTIEEAKNLIENDYMYLACLLVLDNKADGIVSGACHSSSNTLRPALQLIKGKEKLVSSFFLMETNKVDLGENGYFIFADCGLNQDPNSEELASIAKHSIDSYKQIIGDNPKVAFLSHSTYGSSKHAVVDKVKTATELAKVNNPNVLIDGELQLDAAIIPEVASIKCSNSPLQGKANILIFPNLDSGNIGYKLVERFAGAKAYGPLTQGLKYPVNDLSRGSSVDDIVGVIVITALQAIKNMI